MSGHGNRLACSLLMTAVMFLSCSWSAQQQEVLDSYSEVVGAVNDGDWDLVLDMLSSGTVAYLDSVSRDFTSRGLQGYGEGRELLPVLLSEYIDLDGEVTMILIQGNAAEITVSAADSRKYMMSLENGLWKLDLSDDLSTSLDEAFRGSYVN